MSNQPSCKCPQRPLVITIQTCNGKHNDNNSNPPFKNTSQIYAGTRVEPEIKKKSNVSILAQSSRDVESDLLDSSREVTTTRSALDTTRSTNENPSSTIAEATDNSSKPIVQKVTTLVPAVEPRYHGPACAMEVNILEKHSKGCKFKKSPNPNRNELDDKVGSYDVIGRVMYKTCDAVVDNQNSKANGPTSSGAKSKGCCAKKDKPPKPKKEKKEKPKKEKKKKGKDKEAVLPRYESTQTICCECKNKDAQHQCTHDAMSDKKKTDTKSSPQQVYRSEPETSANPHERTHYIGDDCKICDPIKRGREIMALQKIIRHREVLEQLIKSPKMFQPVKTPDPNSLDNDSIASGLSEAMSPLKAQQQSKSMEKSSKRSGTQNGLSTVVETTKSNEISTRDQETQMEKQRKKIFSCFAVSEKLDD